MEDAPAEIRTAVRGDRVRFSVQGAVFTLYVNKAVMDYIEDNMDVFKPVLWPFMRRCGCYKLIYKTN